MWPGNPNARNRYPPLPLTEGDKVVAENPDQSAHHSIHRARGEVHRTQPRQTFFLYVAHTMPHVPLGVSSKFKGKTSRGMYGDVGRARLVDRPDLQVLKRNGIDDQTLVAVTSDNGPWFEYGDQRLSRSVAR
jgi:arylsulfatase A-like enzyme